MPQQDASVVFNQYTVLSLVGKQLLAKDNITAFYTYPNSKHLKLIPSGAIIGEVYTWYVDKNGFVWWEFKDSTGKKYFVRHDENKISLNDYDKQTTPTISQQAQQKALQSEIDLQGKFPYYVEKWGKWVLLSGLVLGGIYIKLKTSKK